MFLGLFGQFLIAGLHGLHLLFGSFEGCGERVFFVEFLRSERLDVSKFLLQFLSQFRSCLFGFRAVFAGEVGEFLEVLLDRFEFLLEVVGRAFLQFLGPLVDLGRFELAEFLSVVVSVESLLELVGVEHLVELAELFSLLVDLAAVGFWFGGFHFPESGLEFIDGLFDFGRVVRVVGGQLFGSSPGLAGFFFENLFLLIDVIGPSDLSEGIELGESEYEQGDDGETDGGSQRPVGDGQRNDASGLDLSGLAGGVAGDQWLVVTGGSFEECQGQEQVLGALVPIDDSSGVGGGGSIVPDGSDQ